MAKRELSSTLRNLKFMQRAAQKEEKPKIEDEEEVMPNGNFPSSGLPKRCVIIMEGDPQPGATKGRMSFLSFNPSIDKLNEEGSNQCPEGSATCSQKTSEIIANRENGTLEVELENSNMDSSSHDPNEDLRMKQDDTPSEAQYSLKNVLGHRGSSPNSSQSSQKRHKREKLDWSVLRPPKSQKKRH